MLPMATPLVCNWDCGILCIGHATAKHYYITVVLLHTPTMQSEIDCRFPGTGVHFDTGKYRVLSRYIKPIQSQGENFPWKGVFEKHVLHSIYYTTLWLL